MTSSRRAALAQNDRRDQFPDFPRDIRALRRHALRRLGLQIHFSSQDVFTPATRPTCWWRCTPAALKTNLRDLSRRLADRSLPARFNATNLEMAATRRNPWKTGSKDDTATQCSRYRHQKLTAGERQSTGCPKEANRCKNFWTLGLMFWIYGRSRWSRRSNGIEGQVRQGVPSWSRPNIAALKAGHALVNTAEVSHFSYEVPNRREPKVISHIGATCARAWGRLAANGGERSGETLGRLPHHARQRIRAARALEVQALRCADDSSRRRRSRDLAPPSARRTPARITALPPPRPLCRAKMEAVGLAVRRRRGDAAC